MKKIVTIAVLAAVTGFAQIMTSCSYGDDIDKVNERVDDLTKRVTTLEELVKTANTNISALQTLVDQLSKAEYVTNVTENNNGYTLTFRSGKTATIANGVNGVDGHSPLVSVKKDTDGNWYWTIDGEWLISDGSKIRANGEQGIQGVQGVEGITPKLRINEVSNDWEVSLDEGKTWKSLGVKATGEKGENGDAFFKSVTKTDESMTIVLVDGTSFEIPLFDTFKKIRDRVQSIVYVPDYSDGMIAVEEGKDVMITYSVMPKTLATVIANNVDKISLEGKTVSTRAEAAATLTVKGAKGDANTGRLTLTATAKDFVAGQYYAFAMIFSDGTSAYQTTYTTVYRIVEPESIFIGIEGLYAGMGTIKMGNYLQFFVKWNPVYTTNHDLTWTSDDKKKAIVDENGFVTIPANANDGDVTITATTKNGKKASITLTIADGKININTDQLKQESAE